MMKSKDLLLSLSLALPDMAMVSNSHLIVFFSDSGFSQLLTLCDVEGFTSVILNIRD